MQEAIRARVVRCPCGARMQASDDAALCKMLRDHVKQEHPHAIEAPPDEQVRAMVSCAAYDFEYAPVGEHDGLEEEGFGPEPY